MLTREIRAIALVAALGIGAGIAKAQQLGTEALHSFPSGTAQMQYTRPADLRKLPNYESLRQHYMGPWLKKLESSMGRLGIKETDVNALILGWTEAAPGAAKQLYGLATGSFNSQALRASAAERHIPPQKIGGKPGYCLGAGLETQCVVILGPSLGGFGTLSTLSQMMDVRNGARPSLETDSDVTKIVSNLATQAPIWGIATHGSVAEWFQNWLPTQNAIQLDWAKVFQNVQTLSYKVMPGASVQLNMELYCKSAEDAGSLQQVLQGLKLAQELAWQHQFPNQPNPFSGMAVAQNGAEISLQLTANYQQLSAAGSMGAASREH